MPGTPGTTGSPQGQGLPPAGALPLGPLPNLRSTPFDFGGSSGATALGPDQGEVTRGAAGSLSGGSPPRPCLRGDDSAKAGLSRGTADNPEASSSGRSSLQSVSQTDAGSYLSTAVFPSRNNSAASSSHRTAGGSGPISRLGQLSYAATSESEACKTGHLLLHAQDPSGAGHLQTVLDGGSRAGRTAAGPADLAAVSHAEGGKRGLVVLSDSGVSEPLAVHHDMDATACSSQDETAPEQQRAAQTRPFQLRRIHSGAHAAADGGITVGTTVGNTLDHSQECRCYGAEPPQPQHNLSGSAIMAQPPRFANADSGKSASGIILSPLSSAGRQSDSVNSADSDSVRLSGHLAAALAQPMTSPERSGLPVPLAAGAASQGNPQDVPQPVSEVPLEQTAGTGAGPAEAQRQPQTAPETILNSSQAEQRNVEEQEVLYNMTGQTGSLMYMAPEVTHVL